VTFNTSVTGVMRVISSRPPPAQSTRSRIGVSGSAAVYTVSVNTGSGDGTLRLDLTDNGTIFDVLYSYPLGGPGAGNGSFTAGEVYTIDKTAPQTAITDGPASLTTSTSASFVYESSEASSTFECSLTAPLLALPGHLYRAFGAHTFQVPRRCWQYHPTPANTPDSGPLRHRSIPATSLRGHWPNGSSSAFTVTAKTVLIPTR
jgi:hypothetical protein